MILRKLGLGIALITLKMGSPCLDFHMYPMLELDNYLKLGSRRYNSQVFDLGVCKSSEKLGSPPNGSQVINTPR